MIERPPLVAEAEWQDTGQISAAYAHTYYPAFIDIPCSSALITPIDGKPIYIYIHLVRQVKALEVTDFANYLYEQKQGTKILPLSKNRLAAYVPTVSV